MTELTSSLVERCACGGQHAPAAHFDLELARQERAGCVEAAETALALAWDGVRRKLEHENGRRITTETTLAACDGVEHKLEQHADIHAARLAYQQLRAAGDYASAAIWAAVVAQHEQAAAFEAERTEVFGE